MAYVYPGGAPNTFVPSFEASGPIINMVNDPSQFKINDYIGSNKVDHSVGYYPYLDNAEAVRYISSNDFEWPDGAEFNPETGFTNTSGFEFPTYKTGRKAVGFTLGEKSINEAAWDIVANEAAVHSSRMMIERTKRTLATALATATWGSNYDTATNLGGGVWGSATSTNFYIRKTILNAANKILLSSCGFVKPSDLRLIVSPYTALRMFATDEVANYVKSSPSADAYMQGQGNNQNWGLSKYFAGVEMLVEDAVSVTTKKGVTVTTAAAMDDNKALLLCKKDNLVSSGVSSRFNTITRFYKEDFTVEVKADPDNRRTVGRVVVDDVIIVTAPVTGYLITNLFS